MSPEQREMWGNACVEAERSYFALLKSGCSAQIARSVLPSCLKAELVMTANFREWRHFIALRGAKAAHPQIRPIAYRIWEILVRYAPGVFEDLAVSR
jgi:thymidylate synthase (FAD)